MMREEPLFTIALPVHNGEGDIRKALGSCVLQNFNESFEVLVSGNCSNDQTSEIIQELRGYANLRLVETQKVFTMYEHHNIFLSHAVGKYILFCHSDDYLDPAALEIPQKHLTKRNFPS